MRFERSPCTRFTLALLLGALSVPAWAAEEQSFQCVIEPKKTIKLGSAEAGILDEVKVERGQRVEEGQVVASLERSLETLMVELARMRAQSNEDIRSASTQVAFRRKELERFETLKAKNVISEKDYDQANVEVRLTQLTLDKSRREKEIAEVEHQHAQQRLDRRIIRSPVNGVVTKVELAKGEYAYDQAPLMTIAQIDPLNVEVFLPVKMYPQIKMGMLAQVTPELVETGTYQAKVTAIDSVFDPSSRTFGVMLELPNSDYALPAGMHCTLDFMMGEEGAIAQHP
ncbi:efflux RND transporter periplasmic adaptor subunit [Marinobacterium lutimaris]|uniref:RND family efflux transporter, MFP subunit n=1 Tax=Marinobacterium lutimaris TaxID=568106 RepID=A0A1H6AH52_9GAMM|nr:efflux RND transporter periplasmic adaptor subunit [Marinobacterium lutimaris]SEG48099.1 RND family efflux transporter, MFP subunit [Marinobacterium lutimaris]